MESKEKLIKGQKEGEGGREEGREGSRYICRKGGKGMEKYS